MFKTVRAPQGAGDLAAELEYTILPQSDDRSPSASSGEDEPARATSSHHHLQQHHPHQYRHYQQQQHHHPQKCYQYHHHQQPHQRGDGSSGTRRTVIIILAMLVLGCGVVAAAVLVPILLAARLVSVPTSARLQTFAVAASGVIHSARGDYVQLLPIKHAPPGTVLEFEPLLERQLQPPPPSPHPSAKQKRKKRSMVARRLRPRRTTGDRDSRSLRTTAGSAAGFRSLDFRIRQ